jgi:hypothetical protein
MDKRRVLRWGYLAGGSHAGITLFAVLTLLMYVSVEF